MQRDQSVWTLRSVLFTFIFLFFPTFLRTRLNCFFYFYGKFNRKNLQTRTRASSYLYVICTEEKRSHLDWRERRHFHVYIFAIFHGYFLQSVIQQQTLVIFPQLVAVVLLTHLPFCREDHALRYFSTGFLSYFLFHCFYN